MFYLAQEKKDCCFHNRSVVWFDMFEDVSSQIQFFFYYTSIYCDSRRRSVSDRRDMYCMFDIENSIFLYNSLFVKMIIIWQIWLSDQIQD